MFPPNVVYPDSYINDIRFDLRPNISGTSGQGVAYMTDSSPEGRNGIITIDLGTSQSWRHLDNTPQVTSEPGFVPIIWGEVAYNFDASAGRLLQSSFGSDGIALSADGDTLYWCPIGSRTLYSVPTERLRDRGPTSELMAQQAVVSHGQKGISDGLETGTYPWLSSFCFRISRPITIVSASYVACPTTTPKRKSLNRWYYPQIAMTAFTLATLRAMASIFFTPTTAH